MNDLTIILTAAVIAGLLDTVVGFGGNLLLLPILVSVTGSTEAVILSAIIPLGWNVGRLPMLRPYLKLKVIGLFTLGMVPGGVIGGLLLESIDAGVLQTAIGILLIGLGLYHIVRLYVDLPIPRMPDKWVFPLVGLFVGVLSGLLGAGNGPFQSWSMSAAGMMPREIIAVNGALGGLLCVVKIGAYGIAGLLGKLNWTLALAGTGAGLLGAIIGVRVARKAPDSTLKLLIGAVIIIAGIRMVV